MFKLFLGVIIGYIFHYLICLFVKRKRKQFQKRLLHDTPKHISSTWECSNDNLDWEDFILTDDN